MRIILPDHVVEVVRGAPLEIRKAFERKLLFLAENLHHPSLHAKKYDEATNLWQARVNKRWRFYFYIVDDTYQIVNVVPHPK